MSLQLRLKIIDFMRNIEAINDTCTDKHNAQKYTQALGD